MTQRLPSFRAFNRLLKLDAADDYRSSFGLRDTEDNTEQKELVQFYLTTLSNVIDSLTKQTLPYGESRFLNVGGGLAFLCALLEGKTISDVYVTDWTKDSIYEQRKWLEDEQGKDLSAIDMLNAYDSSNSKALLQKSNSKIKQILDFDYRYAKDFVDFNGQFDDITVFFNNDKFYDRMEFERMLKNMVSLIKADGYIFLGGYASAPNNEISTAKARDIRSSIIGTDVDIVEWHDYNIPVGDKWSKRSTSVELHFLCLAKKYPHWS